MAKEKSIEENLIEFHFPVEGVTVKAKDIADAQAKLKELLKANN